MPKGIYSRPPRQPCSIPGCDRLRAGRGLCRTHYSQARRRGEGGNTLCSIPGCGQPHEARGWCHFHYQRWTISGDPLRTVAGTPHWEALKWLRECLTNRDRSECWVWPFPLNGTVYPQTTFNGRRMRAGHIALILDGRLRPPAPGNHSLHSCDNPPCCNPAHLRWGTSADNSADMVSRGRGRKRGGK